MINSFNKIIQHKMICIFNIILVIITKVGGDNYEICTIYIYIPYGIFSVRLR